MKGNHDSDDDESPPEGDIVERLDANDGGEGDIDPDGGDDDRDVGGTDRWDDGTSVFVLCARQPFEDWARSVIGGDPDWRLSAIDRRHAILTPELLSEQDANAWLEEHVAECSPASWWSGPRTKQSGRARRSRPFSSGSMSCSRQPPTIIGISTTSVSNRGR